MWWSGQQLDADARDEKAGVKKTINRLALQKREARMALAAKAKKKAAR